MTWKYAALLATTALLVGATGWLVWTLARDLWLGLQSRRWPAVVGRLTRLVHEHDPEYDSHRVDVEYHYEVGGRRLVGRRLRFDMRLSTGRKAALALMAQGQEGGAVRVYHSATRPELSVLRPGLSWRLLGGLAVTVFVGLMAWGQVVGLLRQATGAADTSAANASQCAATAFRCATSPVACSCTPAPAPQAPTASGRASSRAV